MVNLDNPEKIFEGEVASKALSALKNGDLENIIESTPGKPTNNINEIVDKIVDKSSTPSKVAARSTSFMDAINKHLKPSLMYRIVLDGGRPNKKDIDGRFENLRKLGFAKNILDDNAGVPKNIVENHIKQIGGDIKDKLPIRDDVVLPGFLEMWVAKAFLLLYIFIVSMLISHKVLSVLGIHKRANFDDPPDNEESKKVFFKKYLWTILYLFIFVIFTLIFENIIMALIYYSLVFYYSNIFELKLLDDPWDLAKQRFQLLFEIFISKNDVGDMSIYHGIQMFALVGIFIFSVVYLLLVKSFLQNVRYPIFCKDEERDYHGQAKFMLFYIMNLIFFILFCIGMYVFNFSSRENKLFLVKILLYITMYSVLVCFVFKYELRKDYWRTIVCMIALFIYVVFIYMSLSLVKFIGDKIKK